MRRGVVIVIYDDYQLLDMAGPVDVFSLASLIVGDGGYAVEVVAARAGEVRAALADVAGPVDTLMVAGGLGVFDHLGDRELIDGVARLAATARRVTSVCTGAFVLAEAGLLDGRRVTTHWLMADELRARYPAVKVDEDPIYIRDGNVWTSAGVTAGMDLAMALVAEDHGHAVARDVARTLVVYLHRSGGQSQFSVPLRGSPPRDEALRELQEWIDANPDADLSVPALARRMNMSERHFSRVFRAQVGIPPGRYVELSRAAAAQRLLETTDDSLDRVARRAGLGMRETLYRVFRRHLRVSPGDYRRRFRAANAKES